VKYEWRCHCCGQVFDTLPTSYGAAAPAYWQNTPEGEYDRSNFLTSDACVIDGRNRFIRGCIELPLLGHDDNFVWGVWVSLSEKNFERVLELWDAPAKSEESPMFGWLSTNLSPYPRTLNLKTSVHLRNDGLRPFIELEPTDHPLAIEQRDGITIARVAEIASLLHRP
jgi:hypothetical protein